MSEKAKKLNLRAPNDKPLKIDADSIPTLVPEKLINEWMGGDENPYYKVQQIDYPLVANGYNYVESFFESYIGKLNRAPIPGSKSGHETQWGKRPPTDFLLVGAKIEKKKNGKGSVFFKNYIPKEGESGDNSIFIKENKSGMIDFSLVSYTRDERIEEPGGKVTFNVVESMFGERNDAVEYATGAMKQKTNAVGDGNNSKGDSMEKKDILEALLTLKTNMGITLPEIAKHLSLEALIITDEQKLNLSKLNSIVALCGENDPVEFVSSIIDEKKQNAKDVREAKLSELFGTKEIDGKENQVRIYAESIIGDKDITDEVVAGIKENSIFKTLASEQADVNSDFNRIGESEIKENAVQADHVEADY